MKNKKRVKISDLKEFLKWTINDMDLNITGLMCIPPFDEDPSLYFSILRNLCDENSLEHASMGMSGDFAKAIQFGATYLRIGSGIFGNRL